ncbi:hypothetical protein [Rhodococcus sp. SGAir0479]|nr:hypothetical protein [Rhodococcus sp. SGAir0479]
MPRSRTTTQHVTYVTFALGARLPLARELCCRSCPGRAPVRTHG